MEQIDGKVISLHPHLKTFNSHSSDGTLPILSSSQPAVFITIVGSPYLLEHLFSNLGLHQSHLESLVKNMISGPG